MVLFCNDGRRYHQAPIVLILQMHPKHRLHWEVVPVEFVQKLGAIVNKFFYQFRLNHCNTPCWGSLIAAKISSACRCPLLRYLLSSVQSLTTVQFCLKIRSCPASCSKAIPRPALSRSMGRSCVYNRAASFGGKSSCCVCRATQAFKAHSIA